MNIVLDAMGGDLAPQPIVEGAITAAKAINGQIILVGQEEAIRQCLPPTGCPANISIVHASEVVAMDEVPTEALRKKKDSSIAVGIKLVKDGHADAFVSAGNTGAVTAAATLGWRQVNGVHRPAIATMFPNKHDRFLLLDAGASPDVDPIHLLEFAHMGRAYAEKVLGRKNPKVRLINIGEEASKGNAFSKEAYKILSGHDWFAGNIEGKELFSKPHDVVVCDAFVGNILLKTCEGVAEYILDEIRSAIPGWPQRALFLPMRSAMRPLKSKVDYAEYGGSPLLGLNGICIISHGRSNARAIENALHNAAKSIKGDLVTTIRNSIAKEAKEDTA